MADRYINTYHSLPGVAGGLLDGPMSKTPRGMLDTLRKYRATSAAADYGAIMAWVDDDGCYRASLCRNNAVVEETAAKTKVGLIEWLRAWWPAMRDPHFRPQHAPQS